MTERIPEAVLGPDDMLLLMEMAGYVYIPGTNERWAKLRRADAKNPGAPYRLDGDIMASGLESVERDDELRALFDWFLATRGDAHAGT